MAQSQYGIHCAGVVETRSYGSLERSADSSVPLRCVHAVLLTTAMGIDLWHRFAVQALEPRKRDISVGTSRRTNVRGLKYACVHCRWEYFTSLDFELKVIDKKIDRKLPILSVTMITFLIHKMLTGRYVRLALHTLSACDARICDH